MSSSLLAAAAFLAGLAALTAPAAAQAEPRFADAGELHRACAALAAKTRYGEPAPKSDPCRSYLFEFMTAYRARMEQRLNDYIAGAPHAEMEGPCFRIEGFVSFAQIASQVSAYGDANPESLTGAPDELTLKALAANHPCPPGEAYGG